MVPIEVVRDFALFHGLDDEELAQVAQLCHERTFEQDAVCFAQSGNANDLRLCRTGKVNLVVKLYEPWSREVVIYRVKPGEVFGWSALVPPFVYTSSAKCAETTEEIFIRGEDLRELFERNPRIGYVVMTNLSSTISQRLSETRQKLSREYAAATHRDYEW